MSTSSIDFSGDVDASSGASGTTTGAGHGIVDRKGGIASRSGGKLIVTNVGGLDFSVGRLEIPDGATGQLNQDIAVTMPASKPSLSAVIVAVRARPGPTVPSRSEDYRLVFEPADATTARFFIGRIAESTSTAFINTSGTYEIISTYVDGHAIELRLTATGANPTALVATVKDLTTNTVLATITASDSTAGYQTAGFMALFPHDIGGVGFPGGSAVGHVSGIAMTYAAGNALVVSTPTLTSRAAGSNTLAVAISSGDAPYTIEWHAKRNSIDWTPSGATIIAGATTDTLTHSGLTAGDLWVYKVKVTDSGGTPQIVTSDYLLVEALRAAPGLPPLRALTAEGIILATLGDSNTASEPGIGGYAVTELGDTYSIAPIYRINTAVSGDRLTVEWDALTDPNGRISGTLAAIAARLVTTPGALVVVDVMLGTNDARNVEPTAEEFAAAMLALAQVFTGLGYLFVIHTPPFFYVSEGSATAPQVDLLLAYREAAFALANRQSIFAGDPDSLYYTYLHPELMTDGGIHLTDASRHQAGIYHAAAIRQTALAILAEAFSAGGLQTGTSRLGRGGSLH